MDLATVTTPNMPEADALGGAEAIGRHGCHVVLKGGHGDGAVVVDRLLSPTGAEVRRLEGKRFETGNTHGTGCTFASALAYGLGAGLGIEAAFEQAVRFVRIAIRAAPGLGGGHGPLGHHDVRLDCGPQMRLSQISIPGEPTDALCSFYARLGLKLIVRSAATDANSGYNYVRYEAPGGVTLSVYPQGNGIYFECDDLDATVERLQAQGMAFDQLPQDQSWLWRQAWTRDPAGNAICLFTAGENRRFPPWRLA